MDSSAHEEMVISGRWPKIASLRSEWYRDLPDPEAVVGQLRAAGSKVDLFTFSQRIPHTEPRHAYPTEWDEMAVIRVVSFEHWWNEQIPKSTRKHIRRSEKLGVVTRLVPLDDALLKGIAEIYNESPLRDGMPFSHYHASLETLRQTHETYLDRSDFIGAFFGGELVGFVKLVYSGLTARTMQIIAKLKHRDKWPTNAMVAKAVHRCAEKGVPYLVFGELHYADGGNPGLTSFKMENGFTAMKVPRYYIPLSVGGKLALSLGLHRGFVQLLPRSVVQWLRALRSQWYALKYRQVS